jgi:hypothetical protein
MPGELWVVGGEQHVSFREQPEWHLFKTALVLRIADGRVERVLEYRSPAGNRPDDRPSHTFKAATLTADTAFLCTQTEVLICDFPSFALRRVISLPCFNDLHHVTPAPDGTLYLAVTGLDAVAQLSAEGELLRLVGTLGQDPWERFSPEVDYRKIPTTKPHHSHPNYVFFLDGRPWVTRFHQRDAVPLDGGAEPFAIRIEGVHDGHLLGDQLHFTTVDGHLARFTLPGATPATPAAGENAGREPEIFDLHPAPPASAPADPAPLGWCRGLLPLGGSAWVGFTRIRFTTLRKNLSFLRHGFKESQDHRQRPTRIARYDFAGRDGRDGRDGRGRPALVEEIDLEPAGMGAVFSIHGAPPAPTTAAPARPLQSSRSEGGT